jgi:hypothetical protein
MQEICKISSRLMAIAADRRHKNSAEERRWCMGQTRPPRGGQRKPKRDHAVVGCDSFTLTGSSSRGVMHAAADGGGPSRSIAAHVGLPRASRIAVHVECARSRVPRRASLRNESNLLRTWMV